MGNKKNKLNMNLKKIKRAIISVADKSKLEILLPVLKKFNIEIISSGGSFEKIKSMKLVFIRLWTEVHIYSDC